MTVKLVAMLHYGSVNCLFVDEEEDFDDDSGLTHVVANALNYDLGQIKLLEGSTFADHDGTTDTSFMSACHKFSFVVQHQSQASAITFGCLFRINF